MSPDRSHARTPRMFTTFTQRMRRIVFLIGPAILAAASPNTALGQERSRETRFVDSVLARLTLEEKLGQLNQISGMGEPTGPGGTPARAEQVRRGQIGSFLNVVGADTTRKLQRMAVEESRTHIPLIFALD